jgi:hypothetical protein
MSMIDQLETKAKWFNFNIQKDQEKLLAKIFSFNFSNFYVNGFDFIKKIFRNKYL